jgi:hypothetical protein
VAEQFRGPLGRTANVATNLTLEVANLPEIRNGRTKLFAESGKPSLELSSENWAAVDRAIIVRSGFLTNEAAWSWIDRNTDDGRIDPDRRNRIRNAPSLARVTLGGQAKGVTKTCSNSVLTIFRPKYF